MSGVPCANSDKGCQSCVWWSAQRGQWLHVDTGKAICATPDLTTLTAWPSVDVMPGVTT
jgi:hypothetical protein